MYNNCASSTWSHVPANIACTGDAALLGLYNSRLMATATNADSWKWVYCQGSSCEMSEDGDNYVPICGLVKCRTHESRGIEERASIERLDRQTVALVCRGAGSGLTKSERSRRSQCTRCTTLYY